MKYGIYLGFSLGLMLFAILANYGIGFYFGSIFVENGTKNTIFDRSYTAGDVLVVFFSM
mgnify:CR=1 FL=1